MYIDSEGVRRVYKLHGVRLIKLWELNFLKVI